MKPYFENDLVAIYHGDCREVIPLLKPADTVITDPVWPNCPPGLLTGSDRPYDLYAESVSLLKESKRLAIQMGCDSDPGMLSATPLKFFRLCHLTYTCPGRKGRLLYGADIAYLYGSPPISKPGQHLIPGICNVSKAGKETRHPTPRKLKHLLWLVRWWSEPTDIILDPFCGSGTTLLAAAELGRKAIGIEIEEKYCEMAAQRFDQRLLALGAVA